MHNLQGYRSKMVQRITNKRWRESNSMCTVLQSYNSFLIGFMSFNELTGDLFQNSDGASLVHCVSRDLRMGKGIAVAFKKQFGGIGELKKQNVGVGGVAILQRNDRYIYYMITKEAYHQKPTYSSLKSSLRAIAAHIRENNLLHIPLNMPRIGCGLDRLSWDKVRIMIQEELHDVNVTVYCL